MEGERIYCFRRRFISETDNVIETLSFEAFLARQSYRSWALGIVGGPLVLWEAKAERCEDMKVV